MTTIVYLALGSNLGDRLANLQNALDSMPPAITPLETSPVYETPPWGFEDQPPFLNQVAKVETDLNPGDLLLHLKKIEHELGRAPSFRFGPRKIDLDILFYGNQVVNQPDLVIPHPRLPERAFVLVPLNDIAPDLLHPVSGNTIHQMAERTDRTGIHPYR